MGEGCRRPNGRWKEETMGILDEIKNEPESTVKDDEVAQVTASPQEAPPAKTGESDAGSSDTQKDAGGAERTTEAPVESSHEGLLAAKQAEKRRRQDAESQLQKTQQEMAEMRGRLEVVQSLHIPKQEAPKDPDDDLSKLDADFFGKPGETVARVSQRIAEKMQRDRYLQRLNDDMLDMQSEGIDVVEVDRTFAELAKNNPDLVRRVNLAESPGRYAHGVVKRHTEKLAEQSAGGAKISQYEAKILDLEAKLKQAPGRSE